MTDLHMLSALHRSYQHATFDYITGVFTEGEEEKVVSLLWQDVIFKV